jgi:hypothetical protein
MNLNLMDPKLIVLAAAMILVIAVLAWLYMRKRGVRLQSCGKGLGPSTSGRY